MVDRMKTIALFMLVCLSLLQSYLLSYDSPKFDPIQQNEYVPADQFGTQTSLEQLIFPEQIIIHKLDYHTVLYPNTEDYNYIFENVKQTTFDGFRKVSILLGGTEWEEVSNDRRGVEIRFKHGIPFNVLQAAMQMNGDTSMESELVERMWIYANEESEEIKTYFFTPSNQTIYEAQKVNLSMKDIDLFIERGESNPPYHTTEGKYYLPRHPIEIEGYRIPYTQYTAEQLKKSLFVDPGITRNLTEWDGSEIYTDGKRGLQIKNEQHWMNYSDPAVPVEGRADLKENLVSAIQFINQHGGWTGTYQISQLSQPILNGMQTFIFRLYHQAYPIINESNDYYGYMKVVLQRAIVTNYERSVIVPELEKAMTYSASLPGGEELDGLINSLEGQENIVSVYPAYRPEVGDISIGLYPVWVVEYEGGEVHYLEGVG